MCCGTGVLAARDHAEHACSHLAPATDIDAAGGIFRVLRCDNPATSVGLTRQIVATHPATAFNMLANLRGYVFALVCVWLAGSCSGSRVVATPGASAGILRPQDAEFREVRSLDGMWQFRTSPADDPDVGFRQKWFAASLSASGPVIDMPVPASYNDITERVELRDFVGWAWYSSEFWTPRSWGGKRVVLRCGSVHYTAAVFVNGEEVIRHSGGHLPFAAEVSAALKAGQRNLITVAVNNTLTSVTVPQGRTVYKANRTSYVYPEGYSTLEYSFDFFNYAGIHRPILLYTTPDTFVDDVTVTTALSSDGSADVQYDVVVGTVLPKDDVKVNVTVIAPGGDVVGTGAGSSGTISLSSPQLWWPYLMHETPGLQYVMEIQVTASSGAVDIYRQKFGVREFAWNNDSITVNGKPVYIRGFGKHEDSNIRGKGLDLPLVAKDFNLIEWVGANCFRTSHYPYAEEIMDAADSRGILVIDEVPAVNLDYSDTGKDDRLLKQHLAMLGDLINRDKNRPSVFMWSLSNEAKTTQIEAIPYYQQLVQFVKSMDGTRPVVAVLNSFPDTEKIASILDAILVNRYFGWYSDTGHTELISMQAEHFFTLWRETFNKPIVNSEYGADTVAGLHNEPAFVFTEEYQAKLMHENFRAFDRMRAQGWFVGEMIWNFADFMTAQGTTRVLGNKKGIFTRERQPKMSAHVLRDRYWRLARDDDGAATPPDLLFAGEPGRQRCSL